MLLLIVLLSITILDHCCVISVELADFVGIRKSPYFIDKTLFIKEFITNEESLVVAAPSGFGKSANLDMLRLFLSNTIDKRLAEDVFQNTKVSKEENLVKTHLGNYPVIYCSFKPTSPVTDYDSMSVDFRGTLRQAFLQHRYLADSPRLSKHDLRELKSYTNEKKLNALKPIQISVGLYFLSQILEKHHRKQVILLIDDYDSVILDSIFSKGLDVTEVIGFYNAILSGALYQNEHVNRSVLAGTTCVSMKPLTDLDHLECVRFLQDQIFQLYFGFTETEVDELFKRETFKTHQERRQEVRMWYDGYTSPDLTAHIYNTRSVLNFFKAGNLLCFWNKTIDKNAIKLFLQDCVTKKLFSDSTQNINIVVRHLTDIDPSHIEGLKNMILHGMWNEDFSDLFVHLLMEKGYFTFDTPWERSGYNSSLTVKFPNFEICEAIRQLISAVDQEEINQGTNLNIQ